MILILAKCTLLDGKKEEFVKISQELEVESRKEEGCISYALYEDIHNPLGFCYVEQWKDQSAIDAHNQSPHFTRLVPQMNALKASSEVNLYQVCN